jgi:two-component system OmpR family sensor kinase
MVGVLAQRQILVSNLDNDLLAARPQTSAPRNNAGTSPFSPLLSAIEIYITADGAVTGGKISGGTFTKATDSVLAQLRAVPIGDPATVQIPGWGEYRIIHTITDPTGSPVGTNLGEKIYGLPMTQVNQAIWRMIAITGVATVLAVVIAALVAGIVVRNSLRPLNQMANTASKIAHMRLDKGEVDLSTRMPESTTDPNSEVGQVSGAFNKMLDNVSDALRIRQESETHVRQFVADASHELRNPIAAIRGYAELAERDGDQLPEEAAFAVNRIDSEAKRVSLLVEDMLLLARLDNGPNTNPQPTDVVESVLNAVSDSQVASPDHHWSLDLPDEPVTINADRNQLQQVWTNLLSNSAKHTPPGTRVTVSVRPAPEEHVVRIAISDDGPGIDPQIRGRVFERFVRADKARTYGKTGSTGLGLAIVASIVAAHHGKITVESDTQTEDHPGFTTFTVQLPLA